MNVFSVLGPVMVGPSSSHTAGAVRIGQLSRKLLGERPVRATITLYGSFAATGDGHGTDRALTAGLLGMEPSDLRIPDSPAIAVREGLEITFLTGELRGAHPNTARLELLGENGRTLEILGSSVGGGQIRILEIDGITTDFSGETNTLIIHNQDTYGHVAAVTALLALQRINIAAMQLYRSEQGGYAVMVLECDQPVPEELQRSLEALPDILKVTVLNLEGTGKGGIQ